jgi:hypothetical protein
MSPMDALTVAVKGLEPASALQLRETFASFFEQVDGWAAKAAAIKVTSVDQKREMKLARESRLALREIRVNAEKARKRLKEDSLRMGKAIDGLANVIKSEIEPIEEYLREQETFAERAEAARIEALRAARAAELAAVGVVAGEPLGELSEEAWAERIGAARAAHEAALEQARLAEVARAAEAERLAAERERERAEAARVAAENAKLRAEAAERDREAARVAAEREQERAKDAAALRAEREAAEAALRAERDAAARAEQERDREAAKLRAEAERIARELEAAKAAVVESAKVEVVTASAPLQYGDRVRDIANAASVPDAAVVRVVKALMALPPLERKALVDSVMAVPS